MPFKSAAQEGFLFQHYPDIANRWAREYGGVPKGLPKHVQDLIHPKTDATRVPRFPQTKHADPSEKRSPWEKVRAKEDY